jgi:two-component system, chemotaxis family, chemotaxis protein CheY
MARMDHGLLRDATIESGAKEHHNVLAATRTLLVEDNDEIRELVRHFLEDIGLNNITECVDGQEALDLLDSRIDQFDLIICDWNLPHVTGSSLLRHVRMTHPSLPFIMITSRADYNSVIIAREDGVDAYLRKPFLQSELEEKIYKVLKIKNP